MRESVDDLFSVREQAGKPCSLGIGTTKTQNLSWLEPLIVTTDGEICDSSYRQAGREEADLRLFHQDRFHEI